MTTQTKTLPGKVASVTGGSRGIGAVFKVVTNSPQARSAMALGNGNLRCFRNNCGDWVHDSRARDV